MWDYADKMGVMIFCGGREISELGDLWPVAEQVSQLIALETKTMLAKTPDEIWSKLFEPCTLLAISSDYIQLGELAVVGFVTFYELLDDLYELGSLVVRNNSQAQSFRRRGIGTALAKHAIETFYQSKTRYISLLATAKNAPAINALFGAGMKMVPYAYLTPVTREATCVCTGQGEGGISCSKADGDCRLMIGRIAEKARRELTIS